MLLDASITFSIITEQFMSAYLIIRLSRKSVRLMIARNVSVLFTIVVLVYNSHLINIR